MAKRRRKVGHNDQVSPEGLAEDEKLHQILRMIRYQGWGVLSKMT